MTGVSAAEVTYRRLSEHLLRGIYPAGSRLPGERTLATTLRVSRATLRQALVQLEREGRVAAAAQRGWFVTPTHLGEPPSVLISFTEMARSRGLRATGRVLSSVVTPASIDESVRLGIAPTAPVWHLTRLRGLDHVPVSVEHAILPLPSLAFLREIDLTDRSLYAELEARGVSLHRSSYTVQAESADESTAELLGLAPGGAVLVASEVTYDRSGSAVLASVNHYRGDAYRFEADLFRRD